MKLKDRRIYLFFIPVILLCVCLGSWQLVRLNWKRGVLNNYSSAGVENCGKPYAKCNFKLTDIHIDKSIKLTNRFIERGGKRVDGYYFFVPMQFEEAKSPSLVNVGFVPKNYSYQKLYDSVLQKFTPGKTVQIVMGKWQNSVPLVSNVCDKNLSCIRLVKDDVQSALNQFQIEQNVYFFDNNLNEDVAKQVIKIPNNHLLYSITWFLMAGVLLVCLLAFARTK